MLSLRLTGEYLKPQMNAVVLIGDTRARNILSDTYHPERWRNYNAKLFDRFIIVDTFLKGGYDRLTIEWFLTNTEVRWFILHHCDLNSILHYFKELLPEEEDIVLEKYLQCKASKSGVYDLFLSHLNGLHNKSIKMQYFIIDHEDESRFTLGTHEHETQAFSDEVVEEYLRRELRYGRHKSIFRFLKFNKIPVDIIVECVKKYSSPHQSLHVTIINAVSNNQPEDLPEIEKELTKLGVKVL